MRMGTLEESRFRRLAREGIWVAGGQAASVIGALVLVRLLTEHLDPHRYGELALGLTVASIANQVVMGGITAGMGRYYSIAVERLDIPGYLLACRKLMEYATYIVVCLGGALVALLWISGLERWIGLAAGLLFFSLFAGYGSAISGIQNAARQRAMVAIHAGLDAWLKILLILALLSSIGGSSAVVALGYALSALLVAGSQLHFLRRDLASAATGKSADSKWTSEIWRFALPFSLFGGFTWLQQSSDRWALQAFGTTHDVGYYAVLFQLGYTPIALLAGMAATLLGPILYQRSGDATDTLRNATVHRLSARITLSCLALTLAATLAAQALHEPIFRLLVAEDYRPVSHLLPWFVLAGGLFATGQMLALKMMTDLRPAALTRVKIVTALLGVAFNIAGAAWAGLPGVIAALLAFSLVYLAWMSWLVFLAPSRSST